MQVSCWALSLHCSQNKHGSEAQSKPQRPPRGKAFLVIDLLTKILVLLVHKEKAIDLII